MIRYNRGFKLTNNMRVNLNNNTPSFSIKLGSNSLNFNNRGTSLSTRIGNTFINSKYGFSIRLGKGFFMKLF